MHNNSSVQVTDDAECLSVEMYTAIAATDNRINGTVHEKNTYIILYKYSI